SVPVVTGISPDNGLSTNDGVTNTPRLIIQGQAPEDSTITVYRNGLPVGTTLTGDSNLWSFDESDTRLPDGTYYFTATATDALGPVSGLSAPFQVLTSTQVPTAPVIGGISLDTGSSRNDGVTNVNTPNIFGTAAPNSAVSLYRDGQLVGTSFVDSSGA